MTAHVAGQIDISQHALILEKAVGRIGLATTSAKGTAMTDTASNSAHRLLTIHDLQTLLRCGRTTAYARVREPEFPVPVIFSGSAHRWWEHEVLDWVESHRRLADPRRREAPHPDRGSAAPTEVSSPIPVVIRRRSTHGHRNT